MALEDTWHRKPTKDETDPPTCSHKDRDRKRLIPSRRHGRGLQWRVRYQGRTRSFRTKGEAERYWLDVRTTPAEEKVPEVTVASLVAAWLDTKQGLSVKGLEACRGAAAHVNTTWGPRIAAAVHEDEVRSWIGGMRGSTSLRRKALQCLAGSMEIGVQRSLLPSNPCRRVRPPKDQRREAHYLDPDQVALAAREAGDDGPMVWVLCTTGLRIGECVALNVGDVDARRRRLRVRRSKGGKARDVPIAAPVLAMLDLDRPADAPLFVSPTGLRIRKDNWRTRRFYPALRRAGIPTGQRSGADIHDMRHTAASLAIQAGANAKTVQAMLGHASGAMTMDVYAHLFDRSLDDVAERLGALVKIDPGTPSGTLSAEPGA